MVKYVLKEGKRPQSPDWIIVYKGNKEADRISIRTCIEHLYGSWRQYTIKNGKIIISMNRGKVVHTPKELYEAYQHLRQLSKILKNRKRIDLMGVL